MVCSKCGRSNPSDARYCTGCGTPLHDAPQSNRNPDYAATFSNETMQLEEQVADALIGRTLDGRYRLDERLGVGGMGAVYIATRLHIGDTVAVKVLHQEHVSDRQASERFRREAQMAARLKHPNAVSVYDFGISPDGLMYLVMEHVEGRSLRQIIKQDGPLTLSA
ncbi:MAG TPA: protein kinase, partial [Pyrinomonadaceae bacterium]|nr:protein kinase [Pyrinomonadaceae bacterium]